MRRGRPPKYPWHTWLDGERHVLNGPEHFPDVEVTSFRQQVINEARKRDVEIATRVRTVEGVDYVEIKRKPPERRRQRDWDTLFAQPTGVILRKGRDYSCTSTVMRVMVLQAAARRELVVRTETSKDSVTIYPQSSATGMAPKEQEVTP